MLNKTQDGREILRQCMICGGGLDTDSIQAIRDIENEVRSEMEVVISHGLCPKCEIVERARFKKEREEMRQQEAIERLKKILPFRE